MCSNHCANTLRDFSEGVALCETERAVRALNATRKPPPQVNQGVKTDTFTYHPIESVRDSEEQRSLC